MEGVTEGTLWMVLTLADSSLAASGSEEEELEEGGARPRQKSARTHRGTYDWGQDVRYCNFTWTLSLFLSPQLVVHCLLG